MDWVLSCCKGRKGSSMIGDVVNTNRDGTVNSVLWDQITRNVISPNATAIIQPNGYENHEQEFDSNPYGEDGFKAYTYCQLEETVHRLAVVIKKHINSRDWGVKNGDGDAVVAFCLPSTFRMIVTVLAIMELQCAYLAMDAMVAEEQLSHIMLDIHPLLIIIEPHGPILSRYKFMTSSSKAPPVISIDILWVEAMNLKEGSFTDVTPLQERPPEDVIATICYTSGTTALPKPVRISHPTIFNRLVWQWKTFPYQSDDIASLLSRPTSVGFIPELFAPLLVGIPVFILHRYSKPKAEALIGAVQRTQLTHITVSPMLLTSIVDMIESAPNPNKIRGEILTFDLAERFFRDLAPRKMSTTKVASPSVTKSSQGDMRRSAEEERDPAVLVHLYGAAELTSDVIYEVFKDFRDLISKSKDYRVPLGRPIFNTNVCILDEDDPEILPMKSKGEICVSGLSVSLGYIAKMDATTDEFVEKIFPRNIQYRFGHRTDDLGRIEVCNDGIPRVFFDSRCPVVVKLRGKTIRVDNIEKVIGETGKADRIEMFIYSPGRFNQTIVAAVELKEGYATADVRKVLNKKIQTDVPVEVFHLKQIPMMADGKIDHRMLLQKYRKYRLVTQSRERNAHKLAENKPGELKKESIKFINFNGNQFLVPNEPQFVSV